MTLTLPILAAILTAVFLCPTATLFLVLRWWREDRERDRSRFDTDRREMMDRLFARDWGAYKAVEIAERTSSPNPASDYDEWQIEQAREGSANGLHSVGQIVD